MNAPSLSVAPESVPTRRTNSFATCWTRPGALPYLPTPSARVGECVERLERNSWRGQILGAHGVGKSTLLAALARAARRRGVVTHEFSTRSVSAPPAIECAEEASHVALVDSFERLSRWRRRQWRRAAARLGWGLVVTAHRNVGLPTLAVLRPQLADVLAAYERLTAGCPTPVDRAAVRASFARRGGNVREVWFDLYDLHERLTR